MKRHKNSLKAILLKAAIQSATEHLIDIYLGEYMNFSQSNTRAQLCTHYCKKHKLYYFEVCAKCFNEQQKRLDKWISEQQ